MVGSGGEGEGNGNMVVVVMVCGGGGWDIWWGKFFDFLPPPSDSDVSIEYILGPLYLPVVLLTHRRLFNSSTLTN